MTSIISLKYPRQFNIKFAKLFLGFIFLVISNLTLSAAIETQNIIIDPSPLLPSTLDTVSLKVTFPNGTPFGENMELQGVFIDHTNNRIDIAIRPINFGFGGGIPGEVFIIPFGRIVISDDYLVSVYQGPTDNLSSLFDETNLTGTFNLTIRDPNNNSLHKIPANNSTVSGIGEISGWVCDAHKVEGKIDDNDLFPIIYGTPREDSETVCGDLNNGYTFPINWDNLGLGDHRLQIFVDDTQTTSVEFNVSDIESVNYDSTTRIVTIPRVIVDKNKTYINIDLLLGIDGAWDILTIEPEPE